MPHLATVYDKDGLVIDEILVIYFKAPFSFTGEDIVEFQCHGGIVVAELILNEIIANGARLADPGGVFKKSFFKWQN